MPRGGSRGPTLIPANILAARPAFARAVVQRRLELGLSQYDLANLAKIPQASIAAYELAQVRPGPQSRAKLEEALGMELPPNDDSTTARPLTPAQIEQAKKVLGWQG
jgi:ribosome-binding protein aMBF1 (putative translation factor)